jgi:hypothetical protein
VVVGLRPTQGHEDRAESGDDFRESAAKDPHGFFTLNAPALTRPVILRVCDFLKLAHKSGLKTKDLSTRKWPQIKKVTNSERRFHVPSARRER